MKIHRKVGLSLLILSLVLSYFLPLAARVAEPGPFTTKIEQVSDHFDGIRYFNPEVSRALPSAPGQAVRWVLKRIFRTHQAKWPKQNDFLPGVPPVIQAPEGSLYITPVGHGTFLIQMDGVNILTDPIWSERCSPLSWAGPKRKHEPGIRFEDLPPIHVVLVSHNHYDHLDIPTLEHLVRKGTPRSIVPLGNVDLVKSSGVPTVDELDWWQSVPVSPDVEITLVPARHYSARTLWDRNQSLWGGFVISGPSGNVFYAGDTGYGPHFREIAHRFSPITVALLPIAPFESHQGGQSARGYSHLIHMGPAEAVRAHMDLGTPLSIAAHFRVFQLGMDGFNDAVDALDSALKEHNLNRDAFIAPVFGRPIAVASSGDALLPVAWGDHFMAARFFEGSILPPSGRAENIIPPPDPITFPYNGPRESVAWQTPRN